MKPYFIFLLLALTGCATHNQHRGPGIPADKWPDFIPLSKIEHYLGFPYEIPTLGAIFGGLHNIKAVSEAETVVIVIPEVISSSDFKTFETSRDYIAGAKIGFISKPLSPADRDKLRSMLLNYDSYGDGTLCPAHYDFAFRFISGESWVDMLMGYECGEVDIRPQGVPFPYNARLVDPNVLKYARALHKKYRK